MGTVTEHDAAQIRRCLGGKDLSTESSGIQKWQHAGMIHMGMGQENIVNLRLRHRKFRVLIHICPLLHAVVHQHMLSCCLQVVTAARYLVSCPDKHQFHGVVPLFFSFYFI